ncbi:MAG: hypothetical protein MJ095_00190 [Oscillospiraceae bacterium]|nr:hypothetical protein [Oscillospiraceae bacterium]
MPRLKTNYEIISDKSKNPVVSSEYVKHNNEWLNDKLDYIETHTPTLGEDGKIPASQLPSYVDDVLEFANKATFPVKGEEGKIYVDKATNLTWRWSGSTYVEISPSLALGETASTAYAGNKGKQNADDIALLKTGKVDKAEGKGLSTNDYSDSEKAKLASASNGVATLQSTKVDKVEGKGLSTNDYSDAEKAKVSNAASEISKFNGYFTLV